MAASFGKSLKSNCDKKLREISRKCNLIMTDLFTQVVHATPVKDGYLINSWYTSIAGYSTASTLSPSRSGVDSLARIGSLAQAELFYRRDSRASLTNNLDYAYKIEYLGWSRWKAPYGMVRVSLTYVAGKYK